MDQQVARALAGIAAAEAATRAMPSSSLDPEYARLIKAATDLPENQDGADKSWVWPAYEFCRRHFQSVHRLSRCVHCCRDHTACRWRARRNQDAGRAGCRAVQVPFTGELSRLLDSRASRQELDYRDGP